MKNLQGKETLATSAYITLILVSRASLMALAIRDNAIAESSDRMSESAILSNIATGRARSGATATPTRGKLTFLNTL